MLLAVGCRWPGHCPGGGGGVVHSYKGKDFFFLLPWKNNITHI